MATGLLLVRITSLLDPAAQVSLAASRKAASVKDAVACGGGLERVLADRKEVVAGAREKVYFGLRDREFFRKVPRNFFKELPPTRFAEGRTKLAHSKRGVGCGSSPSSLVSIHPTS